MKKVALALFVALSLQACGDNANKVKKSDTPIKADSPIKTEKRTVYDVAKNYGTSIACNTTFTPEPLTHKIKTTVNEVFLLESDSAWGSSSYLVFWGGDQGCAGGSGTYSTFLTVIGRDSSSRSYTVQQPDLFHDSNGNPQFEINSRFVDKVELTAQKHLLVYGGDFDPSDGGNYAGLSYLYELAQENGSWKLIKRTYLGKYQ